MMAPMLPEKPDMETLPELVDDLDTAEISDAPTMLQAGVTWAESQGTTMPRQRTKVPGKRDVPRDALKFEPCRKCAGSGSYWRISSRGRRCFECNGTGNGLSLEPKTVRARERAKEREQTAIQGRIADAAAFRAAHPDIAAWWLANSNFEFARSTSAALDTHGSLTPGQLAGVRKCIDGQAERDALRAAERKAREVSMAGAGFDKLLGAFATAQRSGLKHPALVFERVCFKPAKKYPGSLYVTSGKSYDSAYYGRVDAQGKFSPMGGVSADLVAEVVAIGADPFGQAVAHGKRTGNCCCCGRGLTNAESIELGIGPICRDRWGL